MKTSEASPLVMLHLGLGSFHRAHQALYMHQLMVSGDTGWSLAGGNIRSDMADTVAALALQGGAAGSTARQHVLSKNPVRR